MSTLWTSQEALLATGGSCAGQWSANGVSIDTRSLQPGDLFVALIDLRDGHDFVADALDKGAAAALVSRVPENVSDVGRLLVVDDVLDGLRRLARAARKRTQAQVIGITGSVGKTSTKEMLRTALVPSGKVHAAERSFNNHWGVPLTLARMPIDADFAIIEIGMNAPGEIAPLAKLADLDVAVITTVAPVHLEAFENVEGIAREKATIFEGLRDEGMAVVNADFLTRFIVQDLLGDRPTIWFGEAPDADPILKSAIPGKDGQQVTFLWFGVDQTFSIAASGRHFALNALGVLSAVKVVGADVAQAMKALGHWGSPTGRGAKFDVSWNGGVLKVIDDSFNASPTSMAAALDVLAASVATRKIAILGDMLELGADEKALHAGLAKLEAVKALDLVHTVGPRMKSLHDALPDAQRGTWFETAQDAQSSIKDLLLPDDIVMIKGSKGIWVSKIVTYLKTFERG
ncbi:MAG: UDP-N-acetylmuramoyl-tripeptide--D-alanyl-D-alanine ligase [Pseudomonadota bacterium]